MLKALVEHIIKSLVDEPGVVAVTERVEDHRRILSVTVGEADLGRVIGKDGQTIRAIRILASAVTPHGEDVAVDVSK